MFQFASLQWISKRRKTIIHNYLTMTLHNQGCRTILYSIEYTVEILKKLHCSSIEYSIETHRRRIK
jgi:hypothetical protein